MTPPARGMLEGFKEAAEEAPPARRWGSALGTAAVGAAGLGLGTAAGLGLGELADRLHQRATGAPIPPAVARGAVPALGALTGVAYSLYKAREAEAVRNALEGSNQPDDRP